MANNENSKQRYELIPSRNQNGAEWTLRVLLDDGVSQEVPRVIYREVDFYKNLVASAVFLPDLGRITVRSGLPIDLRDEAIHYLLTNRPETGTIVYAPSENSESRE